MRPGNDKPDAALSAHARRLGFLSSSCDSCGASGMRGPHVDPNHPSGPVIDAVCAACHDAGWRPAPFLPHVARGARRPAALR